MIDTAFIRTLFFQPILNGLEKRYQLSPQHWDIPAKLLQEPMSLTPFLDMTAWLESAIKMTGDPNYLAKIADLVRFEQMGMLGEWFLSSPDLALAFRRINYGSSCLQSGATFHGEQSAKVIKWTYGNHYLMGQQRLLDSLRVAIMFTNVIRNYMGTDYHPIHVEISGKPERVVDYQDFLGCNITWNAPMTRVWIDIAILETGNECVFNVTKPMLLSNLQLDDLLNMPQPQDFAKVMYEMVNYNRYYDRPSIHFVAEKLQLSTQQLSRRLHNYGLNFTSITSYVLCNVAIKYMLEGMDIKKIASLLGYQNVQSFSKAFQRYRGVTPTQYQQRLLERAR
ncbi:TPA: AraC family transcriptional regulator ligand-binding domain-containing protein [Photobacterium damselae]